MKNDQEMLKRDEQIHELFSNRSQSNKLIEIDDMNLLDLSSSDDGSDDDGRQWSKAVDDSQIYATAI